jgi:plasmid stabilization system protein ParE
LKVELSDEAKRQARQENAWWRKHRHAKKLFTEELRAARKMLEEAPKHQVYAYIDGEPVRRMLLEKTRCHVYYVILEHEKLMRIVAIWGASREHGPDLG